MQRNTRWILILFSGFIMSMLPAFQGQASNQQAQAQMNVASAEAESFDEELVQAAPAEGFDVQVSVIPNQFAVNG